MTTAIVGVIVAAITAGGALVGHWLASRQKQLEVRQATETERIGMLWSRIDLLEARNDQMERRLRACTDERVVLVQRQSLLEGALVSAGVPVPPLPAMPPPHD